MDLRFEFLVMSIHSYIFAPSKLLVAFVSLHETFCLLCSSSKGDILAPRLGFPCFTSLVMYD